jgi:two-component system, LytTR family, response regulator
MPDIRAIIVDDEERSRRILEKILGEVAPEVEIVSAVSSVPEAVLAINKNNPDVVFLDVEMPEYNGFELINFFREVDFEIIFITAYAEYAIRAFEVSAIDYLLKPIDPIHLRQAVSKIRNKKSAANISKRLELLQESFKTEEFTRIALPVSDGLLFVEIKNIMTLQADGAYTNVWLKDGSKLLVSKKLIFFETLLKPRLNFCRVHRSHMVNFNFVTRYSKAESYLKLDNNIVVPVAKERKSEIELQLKNIRVG